MYKYFFLFLIFVQVFVSNTNSPKARQHHNLNLYEKRYDENAFYTLFHIDGPSDAVKEMERNMGLSEDVLRHLTIRLDEIPEGPSIMMQAKSDRGDRARRGDRPDRPPRFDRPERSDRDDAPRPERTEAPAEA